MLIVRCGDPPLFLQWRSPMSLLLEIFRCPNVRTGLENRDSDHPCSRIVQDQGSASLEEHQMPEPWMGNLVTAPILFLGSNPSIGTDHEYPSSLSPGVEIESFFTDRFGGGLKEWTRDGVSVVGTDGKARKVWHWTQVKKRAMELLEKGDVTAGVDYALSEVVHCKSKREKGVKEAVDECASRYLYRLVADSGAKVVVSLGRKAERTVRQMFLIPDETKVHGPVQLKGRKRLFAFLPHPSARKPDVSFEGNLSPLELSQLRTYLK